MQGKGGQNLRHRNPDGRNHLHHHCVLGSSLKRSDIVTLLESDRVEPIVDPRAVFQTVLTHEDELKLLDIAKHITDRAIACIKAKDVDFRRVAMRMIY